MDPSIKNSTFVLGFFISTFTRQSVAMKRKIYVFLLFIIFANISVFSQKITENINIAGKEVNITLKEYKVKKGKHDFKPNKLKLRTKNNVHLRFVVKFTNKSIYDLQDSIEQQDWNKGAGLSEHLFSNKKNAALWVWRWNVEDEMFDLSTYFHKDKARIVPKFEKYEGLNEVIWRVKRNQVFIVDVYKNKADNYYRVSFFNSNLELQAYYQLYFDDLTNMSKELSSWFGGSEKAPKSLRFYMSKSIKIE